MLRSLFSGVSGLRNNQTKLDVIGNNIANASTTGFKSGRVTFQDLFSQTVSNAQGPTVLGTGGINAKQVGLGMQVGSIGTNMTNGSTQPTGWALDFAIENAGFFIVSNEYPRDGDDPDFEFESALASDMPKFYTRDGTFSLDYQGNLVTSSGYRVLGYVPGGNDAFDVVVGEDESGPVLVPARMTDDKAMIPIPQDGDDAEGANLYPLQIPLEIIDDDGNTIELASFAVDGAGLITAKYGDTTYYLGVMAISNFANPQGMEKVGANMFISTNNSGTPKYGCPSDPGFGSVRQGALEMSNVDLANEFTEMIITSRAYQANSRTIRTSDEMLQELINLKR